MSKFARNSASLGADPILVEIERPFSNFDFIEENIASNPQDNIPIQRLFSQVRQHQGATLIVEEIEASDDIKEEDEDIKFRKPEFASSSILRLSFFKKAIKDLKEFTVISPEDFIGYAVIKTNQFNGSPSEVKIYESVLRQSRHENNFIHGCPKWECKVLDNTFKIHGFLYAQQNGISNVCAHVALRTALSSFANDGDITYREMNKIIGIDKSNEEIKGLSQGKMVEIIKATNANSLPVEKKDPDKPLRKWIYGSIESGIPAVVVFPVGQSGVGHAVPVIGHTFNEDTWVPRAESPLPNFSYFQVSEDIKYTPSDSFSDMFIIHDDNYGSNYCVPKDYFDCIDDASAIIITPPGISMDSISAESSGAGYLIHYFRNWQGEPSKWAKRLAFCHSKNLLVIRPVLISGRAYVQHLRQMRGWDMGKVITNEEILNFLESRFGDETFWMVELSIPELFSANKRKLGEVILYADSTSTDQDFSNLCMARLPGYFVIDQGGGAANPSLKFYESGINCHVSLYRTTET